MASFSVPYWLPGRQHPGMAAQGPWWPPANLGAPAVPTPSTENAQEPDLQAWYILPPPLFAWLVNHIVVIIFLIID